MEKSSSKKPCILGEASRCAIISDEIDRISQMPDDILHYLLSSVETVDVVRLSVLSRRWKSLWKTTPYLNFNDRVPGNPVWRDEKFHKVFDQVLMNRNYTKITRLSLDCRMYCVEKIMWWINVVLSRNVEQLELELSGSNNDKPFIVPNYLITCESLLSLKLYLPHCILQLPNNLKFKQLTSLYLGFFEIRDEDFTRTLLSECNLLQQLTLVFCFYSNIVKTLDISSSSLKVLVLINEELVLGFRDRDIRISCPNLQTFTYKGGLARKYNFHDVSSVDSLCIDICHICRYDDYENIASRTFKMFKRCKNISYLELRGQIMVYYFYIKEQAHSFSTTLHRLKLLKLWEFAIDKCVTQAMFYMLEYFPYLESLTLVIRKYYECDRCDLSDEPECDWAPYAFERYTYDSEQDEVNAYWKNHLKTMSLIDFTGKDREVDFVKFMLENCLALEKFTVNWSKDFTRGKLIKNRKMMKFRRASSIVEVKIVS